MSLVVYRCAPIPVVRPWLDAHPGATLVSNEAGADLLGADDVLTVGQRFGPTRNRDVARKLRQRGAHDAVLPAGHRVSAAAAIARLSNVVLLALLGGARRIRIGHPRAAHVIPRRRAAWFVARGWLERVLCPVYLLEVLARCVAIRPRARHLVALSGRLSDWLCHITWGRRWLCRSWLGYIWSRTYPPLGPPLAAILGVKWGTVSMLVAVLAAALLVGHGTWVGVVAALYAASSVPMRHSILESGRVEVWAWALVILSLALPLGSAAPLVGLACWVHPVPWAGGVVLLALRCGSLVDIWANPLPLIIAIGAALPWLVPFMVKGRPSFRRLRSEEPMLSLGRIPYLVHPTSLRLFAIVFSLMVCTTPWASPWLLVPHIALCIYGGPGRSVLSPVYVDAHVSILRQSFERLRGSPVIAWEHDPGWTIGEHHEWLAAYALPDTTMLGGCASDHAPYHLVRAKTGIVPGGSFLFDLAGLGVTHVVGHSRDLMPDAPLFGFRLPATGEWPGRDYWVWRV